MPIQETPVELFEWKWRQEFPFKILLNLLSSLFYKWVLGTICLCQQIFLLHNFEMNVHYYNLVLCSLCVKWHLFLFSRFPLLENASCVFKWKMPCAFFVLKLLVFIYFYVQHVQLSFSRTFHNSHTFIYTTWFYKCRLFSIL